MAEVVLSQLSKVFPGGTVALDQVDLTVADGEFVVLVGPSGCGKSTLLRIVAGLEEATGGTVGIGGRVVNNVTARDRDIAMVFQSYALYPHMTVEDNLGFSLRMHKVPRARARESVHDVAHVLSLEPLLDRKPKALSGGQRQRVAMGRAMVRHPAVLLMDEPLSNLDAKLRVAMRGELTRLHQQYRTTTIYVTHDQIEAMTLGDRIAVLNAGRLQQVGTPDELYLRPCNVFVAGFIGSPAMNLAHARVVPDGPDGTVALRVGEHTWPLTRYQLDRYPTLPDLVGRDLIVGLRPPALSLDTAPAPDPVGVDVTAVTVESLGSEKNLLFLPPFEVPDVVGGEGATETELTAMWTASVDPAATVVSGDKVRLRLDLDRAYLFEAATGLAIPTAAVPTAEPTPAAAAATAVPVSQMGAPS